MTLRSSKHIGVYGTETQLAGGNSLPDHVLGTQTFPALSCVRGHLYVDFVATGGSRLQLKSTREGVSEALRGSPLREEEGPRQTGLWAFTTHHFHLTQSSTALLCFIHWPSPHKTWLGRSILWLDSQKNEKRLKPTWTGSRWVISIFDVP